MTDALLACTNLTRDYRDGEQQLRVLDAVDIAIKAGEMLAIIGTSGSGKSTLLHLLGGLDKPTHGTVHFAGKDISTWSANALADWRNQALGFVYQFHHLLPEFDALENVSMPLLIAGKRKQHNKPAEIKKKALEMLDLVGLSHRVHHRPAELSGGERQRVAIARALVNDPALVLADEPTGNLDDETAQSIYKLMLDLNQRLGTAFLIVTHDQSLAARLHRSLRLQQGRLQAQEHALNG